jgi:hypothetical protein
MLLGSPNGGSRVLGVVCGAEIETRLNETHHSEWSKQHPSRRQSTDAVTEGFLRYKGVALPSLSQVHLGSALGPLPGSGATVGHHESAPGQTLQGPGGILRWIDKVSR